MASQALYLKWRPMTFEEVIGQEHVVHTLRNALVSGRVAHAYLFSGPRGTGKTTMARLLAKAVNCLHEDPLARPCNQCEHCQAVNEGRFLDLIEIDAASHTGVDDVRELRDRIAFAPNEGRYKVYIIDEVHRFSGAAFDALLKTIEEPPAHAIFVLATTEIHKVPQTILSRCQRFDFRRIPLHEIVQRLWELVEAEGLQAEEAALELVARQATGSLRDAISLLDQLIGEPGAVLTLEMAQAVLGTVAGEAVQALTAALINGDTATGLDIINQVLDEGADPRQFAHQMVEYLRLVMLVQTGGAALAETIASPEALTIAAEQAEYLPRRVLLRVIKAFNEAASDRGAGWQPQLPLELAFIASVEELYATPEEASVAAPPQQPARQPVQPEQAAPAPPPAAEVEPAEAEPEPPPEEPAEPPAPDAPSLEELHSRWRELLRVVHGLDLTAEALLKSGSIYGIEGYTVVLQMPSDILRDKIEADHTRSSIERGLQQLFQQPLRVRCIVRRSKSGQRSNRVDDL
ncbi:MAG TPA: DNA polymerase III subunit gamma/tau, partial [Chloroflexi bacterium]|nr:DNA polymerase III subunit gamma/tau [Chloroflexota bacterium]